MDDWIIHLDDSDIAEIDGALNVAMSRGVQVPFATADFPLDHLRARLAHLRDMVCHGYGVALLRGLPRDRYTTEECELIYWGIGAHLGRSISQSLRGDLIGYVQDEGGVMDDANVRGYKTAGALQFHCDQLPADILGLFCVNDARMGGESHIVSALAMHNVIRAERPDLLPHLYEPINVDWRGDEPEWTEALVSGADVLRRVGQNHVAVHQPVLRAVDHPPWRRAGTQPPRNGRRSNSPIRWRNVPRCGCR